jgi:hypothetical protein
MTLIIVSECVLSLPMAVARGHSRGLLRNAFSYRICTYAVTRATTPLSATSTRPLPWTSTQPRTPAPGRPSSVCRAPAPHDALAPRPTLVEPHTRTHIMNNKLSMALHVRSQGTTQTHPARGRPSARAMRRRQHSVDRCSSVRVTCTSFCC